jgi:hypothetical protein
MLRMCLVVSFVLAGVASAQAQVSCCSAVQALVTGSFEYRLPSIEELVEGPLNLNEAHRVYEYPAKSCTLFYGLRNCLLVCLESPRHPPRGAVEQRGDL